MKQYTATFLLSLFISVSYADSLSIGTAPVIGNLDPIVSLTVLNNSNQDVVNRDRRHEAGAALLLGIIDPKADESKIAKADNKIDPDWTDHDIDHGLGDGLIINDPEYYQPAEKTTIK